MLQTAFAKSKGIFEYKYRIETKDKRTLLKISFKLPIKRSPSVWYNGTLGIFFFKLIAVLFCLGFFTGLIFSLCIKLDSTTGHWANQARDFQLWLKGQNLLLISWTDSRERPE